MENVAAIPSTWVRSTPRKGFGIDTIFVLFFLATDLGRGFGSLDFGSFLSLATICSFIVFSFFMPSPVQKPSFPFWVGLRVIVAGLGLIAGLGVNVISEVLLMENIKFYPMIFLILTGILCAATQIRGIIEVRLAG
jgi:hypothetical protein